MRPIPPFRARPRLRPLAFACACSLASAIGFATARHCAVERLIMSMSLLIVAKSQNRSKMHGFAAILEALAKVNK
jgi:hypothetical protein